MGEKFKLKTIEDLFKLNMNIPTYNLFSVSKLFKIEVTMNNINIYKGEKYPITVNVTPTNVSYSNFTIESCDIEIKNKNGFNIEVFGEQSIDEVNKSVLFSWDTSQYPTNTYIIVIWVSIMFNGTLFKLCTGNISRTIRDINIVNQDV